MGSNKTSEKKILNAESIKNISFSEHNFFEIKKAFLDLDSKLKKMVAKKRKIKSKINFLEIKITSLYDVINNYELDSIDKLRDENKGLLNHIDLLKQKIENDNPISLLKEDDKQLAYLLIRNMLKNYK